MSRSGYAFDASAKSGAKASACRFAHRLRPLCVSATHSRGLLKGDIPPPWRRTKSLTRALHPYHCRPLLPWLLFLPELTFHVDELGKRVSGVVHLNPQFPEARCCPKSRLHVEGVGVIGRSWRRHTQWRIAYGGGGGCRCLRGRDARDVYLEPVEHVGLAYWLWRGRCAGS